MINNTNTQTEIKSLTILDFHKIFGEKQNNSYIIGDYELNINDNKLYKFKEKQIINKIDKKLFNEFYDLIFNKSFDIHKICLFIESKFKIKLNLNDKTKLTKFINLVNLVYNEIYKKGNTEIEIIDIPTINLFFNVKYIKLIILVDNLILKEMKFKNKKDLFYALSNLILLQKI